MNILYHHRTQGRGAEGNHIVSIVNGMRSLDHRVEVLSPPGVDPFDRDATIPTDQGEEAGTGWSKIWSFVSNRLPGALFELAELLYNVPAYFRLRAALRRGNYDLLFERYATYLCVGALASRATGIPLLLEINGISSMADRNRKQHFTRLCGALEKWLLRRCECAHAVSSYLGEGLREAGLPPDRLVVVPNGFDVERISINEERDRMRERFGFQGCTVIGFAGWFVPWDRLDLLVEVFGRLFAENGKLRLCLVGEGEVARDITQRLESTALAESIVITGAVRRSEVYDYMQMFDIGVLPHSNMFGSPMVMFEMMGLHVPIVAPRLPPIEDVLVHQDTGLLFNPLDGDEMGNCLSELIEAPELRRRLAANAFSTLEADYSWKNTAARILAPVTRVSRPGAGDSETRADWR